MQFACTNSFKALAQEESLDKTSQTELEVKLNFNDSKQLNTYQENVYKWLESLKFADNLDKKALIHNNLAIAYRQLGKLSESISQWQQAIDIYRSSEYQSGQLSSQVHKLKTNQAIAKLLIGQAQVYITIGQAQQAIAILKTISPEVGIELVNLAKGTLGNAYFAQGKYDLAIATYRDSLSESISKQNSSSSEPANLAASWLNLGNALTKSADYYQRQSQVEMEEGDRSEAIKLQKSAIQDRISSFAAYNSSLQIDGGHLLKAQAYINLARLSQQQALIETERSRNANLETYLQLATQFLEKAKPSQAQVFALINMASIYEDFSISLQIKVLTQALTNSRMLGDSRNESFALGSLGRAYENLGDYEMALQFTNQALWLAQSNNAADSLYLWQWQAGRILKAQGNNDLAIASYRQAIATLQSIRSDILAADRSFQFDIRDQVEPIYRELIELLLIGYDDPKFVDSTEVPENNLQRVEYIEEALKVLKLLRLSNLENFFGDACVDSRQALQTGQVSQEISKVALIYSIILNNKTYLIINLPNGTFKVHSINLPKQELIVKIKRLRFTLENVATDEYLTPTREIYNLMIAPIERELERSQVKVLAFINDGILQTVPMAALHDGKKFLIEKYPVVYLTDSPTSVQPNAGINSNIFNLSKVPLSLVSFGLSDALPPFRAIPNVVTELKQIAKIWSQKNLDGSSSLPHKSFLNGDFTVSVLLEQVGAGYNVVHLATHARFGAKAESTFLQAYDQRINLNQLEAILQSSKTQIELLILSACQTATGDSRATLGLAGVALRSGVNNVLATLWAVDDADVVPLITDFYSAWQLDGLRKAQALQSSQIKAITKNNLHPASWSAFILVVN
ncbi:MAG: hypothetical protein DCE90_16320 [Pseudanabaena sp.]|nr:MAG: hypothetical protein DCE90_16320 [Pseudanabaena sp.]